MPVRFVTPWFSADIQEAFSASDELWVEHPPAGRHRQSELVQCARRRGRFSIANVFDERVGDRANAFLSDVLGRMNDVDRGRFPTLASCAAEAAAKTVHTIWRDAEEVLEQSANLPEPVHVDMFGKTLDDWAPTWDSRGRSGAWFARSITPAYARRPSTRSTTIPAVKPCTSVDARIVKATVAQISFSLMSSTFPVA